MLADDIAKLRLRWHGGVLGLVPRPAGQSLLAGGSTISSPGNDTITTTISNDGWYSGSGAFNATGAVTGGGTITESGSLHTGDGLKRKGVRSRFTQSSQFRATKPQR